MIVKIFGRELFRVERNRNGSYFFEMINGSTFGNSHDFLKLSLENPVLMTIIALRAKMYSQMKITHVRADGEPIVNSPYLKLLKKPNYFQSQADFLFQQMWYLSANGNCLTYQIEAGGMPKHLYNLIPTEVDFQNTQKLNDFIGTDADFRKIEKQNIKYTLDKQTYYLPLKSIIPFYDLSNGIRQNEWMISPSRVKGIEHILSNIEENVKAKNLNLQFSQKYLAINKQQVNGTSKPLQEQDRTAIADVLKKNSLQISSQDIEVKHLISDLKRLYLDEQFSLDALKCLLAFDMNKDILNYFGAGSSTFENQEKGELRYLQTSIVQSAENTMDSLSQTWGLLERGEKLVGSYDHLPIMQSVLSQKVKTYKDFLENLEKELTLSIINENEAKEKANSFRKTLGL